MGLNPLSWLLPDTSVSFHHSPNPLSLSPKKKASKAGSDGAEDDPKQNISLSDLCKAATPEKCQLNPLLFNGHLQTAYTVVKNVDVPIYYKRKIFEADNAVYKGQFVVDFVVEPYDGPGVDEASPAEKTKATSNDAQTDQDLPPRTTFFSESEAASLGSTDTKPMLVALHGLSGGSHELYLRHVLAPLVKSGGDGDAGWEACVVNSRGCANSKITTGVLYNARATWDVRQAVRWLREKFPNRPLFGIGFSLGANILTNYLGEEEVSSMALKRTWTGLEVYSKTMGTNMKKLFEAHVDQISKNPAIDVERIRNIKYLHEFDRELQCPTWGYPTENAYYRDASSVDSLLAIRIPFFAIHAEDDPISVKEAVPYAEFERTPYGVLCTTAWGGHLSWFEIGGGRWFAKPATNFLNKMAKEIDLESPIHVDSAEMRDLTSKASFDPMRRKLEMVLAN
ncbi:hypothetical protein FQN54_008599 [Arachnomyces sp. PD_36]|nr:hypothetical protein FQN54_008599 [Arachnomyces sp. PD_36]